LGEKAGKVKWHLIGALQKNKINKALRIFDCIQTVDSSELAEAINKRAHNLNKKISIFIEINIGSEITKTGVKPEYEVIKELAEYISKLNYLKLEGLMTMGPRVGNPEDVRIYFRKTKEFFNRLKEANIPNVELRYLSMGMSNSYKVAIEEGANMIRLGTVIFGRREYQ
ncbi:MAG: YggS family pyridoxal phosphate-dependent enzyme, partial [Candidatus Omnitrophica bacterium]|nr:YggS family pyridoxal phosphate-dependent enzyme [Candidatus Omnitrophota bacterium]